MPQLIIKRNTEWANKFRPFELYFNGKKVTDIHDRQLLTFEIPEGDHSLYAKVGSCGSETIYFSVAGEEIRRIEIRGFVFSKYLLPLALLTGTVYFGLYFRFNYNSLLLATIMMFFLGYLIYFISFGKKQYLRLILS